MTDWIIFVIAIGAVALFVLGLSLTQIFKGHPIDSEIGTNRHMRATRHPVHSGRIYARRKQAIRGYKSHRNRLRGL